MKAPEAVPLGYVEDAFEVRTPLADLFSILPGNPRQLCPDAQLPPHLKGPPSPLLWDGRNP